VAGSETTQALADRAAASDVVIGYAMALDARDWTGFRSLFEERVDIDYSSLGSIQGPLAADAWVARCRVLGAFDATQHKVSNLTFAIDGGQARVTAYVDAAHFITHEGQVLQGFACGTYEHRLRRSADGWKIAGCAFRLAGHPGGRAAFDQAFAVARAAFAASAS